MPNERILFFKPSPFVIESVIGVPCYGGKSSTESAIRSICQSLDKHCLLLISVERFSSKDLNRIRDFALDLSSHEGTKCGVILVEQLQDLGLVKHWNVLIDWACSIQTARFFAWGSDHDYWANGWYSELRTLLAEDSGALLAVSNIAVQNEFGLFPVKRKISSSKGFRTRITKSLGQYGPGYSVYGLFDLRFFRTGIRMNQVLLPDRLLLSVLAAVSPIAYSKLERPVLWIRTEATRSSPVLERQRALVLRGFFPKFLSYLSWNLIHLVYSLTLIPKLRRISRRRSIDMVVDFVLFQAESFQRHRQKKRRKRSPE